MKIKYFAGTLLLIVLINLCLFGNNVSILAKEGYFAIGDNSISQRETYVEKLQKDKIKSSNFTKKSIEGLRLEDLYYLIDLGESRDAYGEYILKNINRDQIMDKITNASYISLSFNNLDFSSYQMSTPVPFEVNLEKYLTDEQITELENMYKEYSGSLGGVTQFQDTIISSLKSYLYNYLGNLYYINKLADKLLEINPEVTIIYINMFNPYKNISIELDSFSFNLGEMYDMTLGFADGLMDYDHSYMSKVVNVVLGNVETVFDREIIDSGITPNYVQIFQSLMKNPSLLLPSSNGHEYIKETIINRMNNVCAHEANLDDGDCTTDIICKLCGVVMVDGNADHISTVLPGEDATCAKGGLTEGSYCADCGKVLTIRRPIDKLPHTYSNVCDEKCDVCSAERTTNHTYGDWELIKEATRKEAGEEARSCLVCGDYDFRAIPQLKGIGVGVIFAIIGVLVLAGATVFVLYKKNIIFKK